MEVRGNRGGNGEPRQGRESQPRERETRTVTGHPETRSLGAREAHAAAQRAGGAEGPESPTARFVASRATPAEHDRMLKDAREIRFPVALRGYERVAVDRYVREVNRLIAELEISSSPESAIRHALDEVSEETRDLLQRAHQTAEEVTARSRAQADVRLQQAEAEAQEARERAASEAHEMRELASIEARELREASLRESEQLRESAARDAQQLREAAQRDAAELRASARREADGMMSDGETRARDLAHSAEAIWRERRRLIEDMRAVGEQLVALGDAELKRFPRFAEEIAHALDAPRSRPEEPPGATPGTPADH